MAETFHTLGYRKIAALNTAEQDLNTVKIDNKLLIGDGGAGKDREFAKKIFKSKREDIVDFMRYSFGDHLDRIFVCAGAGGGTGAGVACQLAEAAKELQETVNAKSKKVGMILALPKKSEGAKVAGNAADTLSEAWDLVKSGVVSPLIILDNERINKLYPKLVVSNFWNTANMSVAGLFHLFNLTTAKDSTYTSFDSNDYKTILDSGLMVFGASPVKDWKDPVSVSRAIRENLQNNLLSGDIDLSTGDTAAAVIIGNKEQLDNIPQSCIDQAVSQLNRVLKSGSTVHNGIYTGDRDTLTIFTAIGGLGKPKKIIEDLKN
jgi:cell division protein FtsZ